MLLNFPAEDIRKIRYVYLLLVLLQQALVGLLASFRYKKC